MFRNARLAPAVVAAVALALAPVAAFAQQATEWTVDRDASKIGFSGTHAGQAFDGEFGKWTARIRFDPAELAQSRIIVVIDTSSATTGDKVQETTLANPEWFDSSNQRFATFRSTSITARGGNRYSARGLLEIKGKETGVTMPITVAINGNKARGSGTLTLDRTALDMGMTSDPGAKWVSRNIDLSIDIAAKRS